MPDLPSFPEEERRRSAHVLSVALGLLSIAGAASAVMLYSWSGFALDTRLMMVGLVAMTLLCVLAMALEWRRTRQAEAVALFGVIGSVATGIAQLTVDQWVTGLAQAVLGVVAAMLLANRFVVRDESRHRARST